MLQPMVEEPDWKAMVPGGCSAIPIASPLKTTPLKPERGQHDHEGKESPVLGDVRHIWLCIMELYPKKTKH